MAEGDQVHRDRDRDRGRAWNRDRAWEGRRPRVFRRVESVQAPPGGPTWGRGPRHLRLGSGCPLLAQVC